MRKANRVKTSKIWLIPKEELEVRVKNAQYLTDVLLSFNLQNKGGNYKTLWNRLEADGIDYRHITRGRGHRKGRERVGGFEYSPEEIFVENSPVSRATIRRRLTREKLLPYICDICKCLPEWNDKPLTLILDHKNGISNDHRIENLRWVCPNCNSQLETHCGRNNRIVRE